MLFYFNNAFVLPDEEELAEFDFLTDLPNIGLYGSLDMGAYTIAVMRYDEFIKDDVLTAYNFNGLAKRFTCTVRRFPKTMGFY